MRLRLILIILSLQAFLSAAIGGYLYYSALKKSAFKEAEQQMVARVETINRTLTYLLSENIKPADTLAGMRAMRAALVWTDANSLALANAVLDHFKHTLEADVCYLMDPSGLTIASSNRKEKNSFVGKRFAFRPYFQRAIKGSPHAYLAIGTTSKERGAYYSSPVYADPDEAPVGVVVIKAAIQLIEKKLGLQDEEILLVSDPAGIIFISNRRDWLFHSREPLSPDKERAVRKSRQFGSGPWPPIDVEWPQPNIAEDTDGNRFLVHKMDIKLFPGWQMIHLRNMLDITRTVSAPLIRVTGPLVILLCLLIGVSVFFFYQKASNEIRRRKEAENALRENEERFRTLYHNTPAMLHSIDTKGRLISVSNHWTDVMGYTREEVIGRPLSDFFTPESRQYAEAVVFRQFFESGFCKDIPYQFIRSDGSIIDVLLSAIAERNEAGHIIRSLAVSIDVTERKKAEEALKNAKEALRRYSEGLERQVRKRTREITNIFRYIPAAVYMKDISGQYMLVNSRFEEVFGITNADIQQKTDAQILPPTVAAQFRVSETDVVQNGKPCQVEEEIPQADGLHTYLSVKFPIYDEKGNVNGVCGILTDITAVKKTRDQLRRLSANIMENQENERTAIARELHDELGQILTALRMDAVWLQERMRGKDEKAAARSRNMCDLIDNTIEEVRSLAIRLRPGVLDDLGLVDALEWYTADFERRSQITCTFEYHDIPEIHGTVATAIYRIVQEALTNVARHAQAAHVDVILSGEPDHIELEITDSGSGFDPAALQDGDGLGMAGMRERAGLVGGQLAIHSAPGKGTGIICRIPLKRSV